MRQSGLEWLVHTRWGSERQGSLSADQSCPRALSRVLCHSKANVNIRAVINSLTRVPNADCVSEGDLVAPHLDQSFADLIHELWVNLTLIRTPHHTAYIAAHFNSMFLGHCHDFLKPLQAFLNRSIYVLPCKFLTCGPKDCYLFNVGQERVLHAARIWHEHRIADTLHFIYVLEDLGSIG